MTPVGQDTDQENKIFFAEFGDDSNNIPPIPPKKSMSSNDADYEISASNEASASTPIPRFSQNVNHLSINLEKQQSVVEKEISTQLPTPTDHKNTSMPTNLAPHHPSNILSDETLDTQDSREDSQDHAEIDVMRQHFEHLVNREAQARGMSISIPKHQQMQEQYGKNPRDSKLISLYHQQSLRNAMKEMGVEEMGKNQQLQSQSQRQSIQQSTPIQHQQIQQIQPIQSSNQSPQSNGRNGHHAKTSTVGSLPTVAVAAAYTDISTPTPKHPSDSVISPASSGHQNNGNQYPNNQTSPHNQVARASVMSSVSYPALQHAPVQQAQPVPERRQSVVHPAVQKLYEQQQTLLEKLQLLEQDDPDPQSAKVEYVYQYEYEFEIVFMRNCVI